MAIIAPDCHAARLAQPTDSLLRQLHKATTAADSLPTLLHLYDAADRAGRSRLNHIIYSVAQRAGAPESLQLDLLRQIANSYNGSDSIQLLVLRETATHPESPDRLETEAFIRLLIINSQAHYLSDQQRDKNISAIIQRLTNDAPDDRLELLELYYSLCIYLSQMSRGEVLSAYMARRPKRSFSTVNGSAMPYPTCITPMRESYIPKQSFTHEPCRATKTPSSDRRPKEKIFQSGTHQPQLPHTQIYLLPANAQQLSGTERTRDRGFRRFDHSTCRSRQGCGRRHQPEPSLRHLLFHGHRQICRSNAAAQTISRREYRTPQKFNHHKFYRMLEEAAEATGDSTTLLATARLRNKMFEQLLKSKSEECYRELSVLYEVDKLKSERNNAEIEARESIISSHKTRLVITVAALAVLLVITIALLRLYRHAKALSRQLRDSNTRLGSTARFTHYHTTQPDRGSGSSQKSRKSTHRLHHQHESGCPRSARSHRRIHTAYSRQYRRQQATTSADLR